MVPLKLKNKIIEVRNLSIQEPKNKRYLLKNLSFDIGSEEVVGVIGESGAGKTILASALMGLLAKNLYQQGHISFLNSKKELKRWKEISMVFQDPQVSLNPFYKVRFQMQEVLNIHFNISKKEGPKFLEERLEVVGFEKPKRILEAYPHQLSGGEKQRVLIAMALLCDPQVLIADEPTASLDLLHKIEILKLLKKLHQKGSFALLFISHDLSSALKISDRILVMKQGEIVDTIFPRGLEKGSFHPYTQSLLESRIVSNLK